jgi:signal transduction histidine kinase
VTILAGPGRDSTAPATWFLVVLWALVVLAERTGIDLPLPVGAERVTFVEVVLVPVIVLLPPQHAVWLVLSAELLENALGGRQPVIRTVFNTSTRVTGVAVAAVVYHALASAPFEVTAVHVLVAMLAALILVVANGVVFAGLTMVLSGDTWRGSAREVGPSTLFDYGVAATGVLAAVLVVEAPIALPLLLVPTAVDVLRMRARAQTYELRAGKERAEAANLAKSQFLSRVSHELRTPLNVILGYGQLLEIDDDLPEDAREPVAAILGSGRHLLGLIDEVLDISRIESGRLDLDLQPLPVATVVEESVALVRPLAVPRRVRLTVDVEAGGAVVIADRQRLVQVLLNLLTNAINYDREGGRVSVTVRRSRSRVLLAVSDTGPGIPAEEMERLFVPFERLASAAGTTGTGLGLSITRYLVEAMGGELTVVSPAGEGATFTVALPAEEQR